jgi:hypothetical protein
METQPAKAVTRKQTPTHAAEASEASRDVSDVGAVQASAMDPSTATTVGEKIAMIERRRCRVAVRDGSGQPESSRAVERVSRG